MAEASTEHFAELSGMRALAEFSMGKDWKTGAKLTAGQSLEKLAEGIVGLAGLASTIAGLAGPFAQGLSKLRRMARKTPCLTSPRTPPEGAPTRLKSSENVPAPTIGGTASFHATHKSIPGNVVVEVTETEARALLKSGADLVAQNDLELIRTAMPDIKTGVGISKGPRTAAELCELFEISPTAADFDKALGIDKKGYTAWMGFSPLYDVARMDTIIGVIRQIKVNPSTLALAKTLSSDEAARLIAAALTHELKEISLLRADIAKHQGIMTQLEWNIQVANPDIKAGVRRTAHGEAVKYAADRYGGILEKYVK